MCVCVCVCSRVMCMSVLEQTKLLTAVYDAYIAQNLSYDCFRYSDHNSVAECDCLACLTAQPDFVQRMCRFREIQEHLYEGDLVATRRNLNGPWKAICDQKCSLHYPFKCCDPAQPTVLTQHGCPVCLPTRQCKNRLFVRYHTVSYISSA